MVQILYSEKKIPAKVPWMPRVTWLKQFNFGILNLLNFLISNHLNSSLPVLLNKQIKPVIQTRRLRRRTVRCSRMDIILRDTAWVHSRIRSSPFPTWNECTGSVRWLAAWMHVSNTCWIYGRYTVNWCLPTTAINWEWIFRYNQRVSYRETPRRQRALEFQVKRAKRDAFYWKPFISP